MTATRPRRRRLGASLGTAFALSTYVWLGVSVPARAANACGYQDIGGVSTYVVTLDDTAASYTIPVDANQQFNYNSLSCGAGSLAVGDVPIRFVVNGDSFSQTLTFVNAHFQTTTFSVDLGGGDQDSVVLQGNNSANVINRSIVASTGVETVVLDGLDGDDILNGAASFETLNGGAGNDTIGAGGGNDIVDGGPGADTMGGGAGTDTLTYESSNLGVTVTLNGSASLNDASGDVISSFERLRGSDGSDTLTGTSGPDNIDGRGGDDTIEGGPGNDILFGQLGADTISGGRGDDLVYGGDASPTLAGDVGDFLNGNGGADTLRGSDGGDTLLYGGGIDIFYGDDGADNCQGYAGSLSGSGRYGRVTYYTCDPAV